MDPGGAESVDFGREVIEDEVDTVAAAGSGPAATGHPAPGRAARSAEQQPQVAAGHVGKGQRCLGDESEAEVSRIESDGGIDIVDHVTYVDGGHRSSSSALFVTRSLRCAGL